MNQALLHIANERGFYGKCSLSGGRRSAHGISISRDKHKKMSNSLSWTGERRCTDSGSRCKATYYIRSFSTRKTFYSISKSRGHGH
jgi:hypothetical protein